MAQKRLSRGKFVWWPQTSEPAKALESYEVQLLMAAGDVSRIRVAAGQRAEIISREKITKSALPRCVPKKQVHTAGVELYLKAGVDVACYQPVSGQLVQKRWTGWL